MHFNEVFVWPSRAGWGVQCAHWIHVMTMAIVRYDRFGADISVRGSIWLASPTMHDHHQSSASVCRHPATPAHRGH